MITAAAGTSDIILIIGIIVAAVVLVAIVVIAVLLNRADKKKRANAEADTADGEAAEEQLPPEPSADERRAEEESAAPAAAAAEPVAEQYAETAEPTAEIAAEPVTAEEAPSENAADDKKPRPKATPGVRRPAGSWSVEFKREGEYVAVLSAKNGELMLESEIYSSEEGARSGIATIVRNITGGGKFVIYRDKNGNYYFKLKSSGNKLLCIGEIYRAKDQCEKAVESVKRLAADAPIAGGVSRGDEYIEYKPSPVRVNAKSAPGKWVVKRGDDDMWHAMLYAGNGQLMLATEGVSSQSTALAALDAVRKNAAEGNFVIDRDKFGRYCYKLRNARKSVICIGETYDSLPSCTKAIETVRRYCSTAEVQ